MPRLPALLLIATLAPTVAWAQAPPEALPEVVPAVDPAAAPDTPPDILPEAEAVPEPAPIDLTRLGPAQLSEKLNDDDYAVREAAMGRLLIDTSLDEAKVAALMKDATTPEQRQRLLAVAEHHIIRVVLEQIDVPAPRNRAGIGFSHSAITPDDNPHADTAGVLVTSTMPGFPGYAYLRPGDVILSINGQACPFAEESRIRLWVSSAVTTHPGGAEMTLGIARGGEEIEAVFNAVNVYALEEMYNTRLGQSVRDPAYDRQWQEARARLTADLPGPVQLVPAEDE